ncbi:helix-turn-helix domain-containing protein [Streptomyces sp. NBC_01433]|uniref:helix-turn-helix domain-containing protein n=1 Tax=Streptomyces sp. NBC_01433 TaxID=2903864 RepID=UPI00225946A0|nr:helix-turn-helix domain-containing protein [Streptomyces sp. NBC_01433]MCX4681602.1 helix-turn-helix domain-containing protein [Streptomyces sp. NBC_01433]
MTEAQPEETVADATAEPEVRVHRAELLARRGLGVAGLAERIGIHPNNVSRIKNGHIDGMKFATFGTICRELDCQPWDLLTYE